MSSQPGYDPVFQAITGIMSICGIPDGEHGAGADAGHGAGDRRDDRHGRHLVHLAALLHKRNTGVGQYLDVALLDVAFAVTVHLSQTYLSTGKLPKRVGNGSLLFAPSNCFPCQDGHILIQIGNDSQWTKLARCLDSESWLADERFVTNRARMQHAKEVNAEVSELTQQWKKQALSDVLGVAGVPSGPVNDMAQAFEHPQVKHRGLRMELDHPVYGKLAQVRSPFRFSETPVQFKVPPALGAHTESVLAQELGLSVEAISALREARII